MAGKQQPYTSLQEQVDYQQQRDHFPLLPRGNQPEQAGYQPPQASYPPQHGSYPPQQPSYLPQQGSYAPQQASYLPEQAGYLPQQAGYPPQQVGYSPRQASYQPQEAGYPPQQGYSQPPPQQQAFTTEVINQQPSVVENTDGVVFGESSVRTVCPHCRIMVTTTTHRVPGLKACLCFVLLGYLACCCLDDFMDVVHSCPFCKNKIAIYEQPL